MSNFMAIITKIFTDAKVPLTTEVIEKIKKKAKKK